MADIAERFGAEFSEAERAKQIADGILTVAGPVPTIEGLPSREAW